MYVNERFVFLHLPRAGGTFIRALLTEHFPDTKEIGYHFPRRLLPERYRGLPLLGTHRDPWSFYVSLYHRQHQALGYRELPFLQVLLDRGYHSFPQYLDALLRLGSDDALLDDLLAVLPDQPVEGVGGMNLSRACLEPIRNSSIGFFSHLFQRHFGDGDDVHFARLSSLRTDLSAFFENIGLDVDEKLRSAVLTEPKAHAMPYGDYLSYYDQHMIDLVALRDASIVERFHYSFPGALRARPLSDRPARR